MHVSTRYRRFDAALKLSPKARLKHSTPLDAEACRTAFPGKRRLRRGGATLALSIQGASTPMWGCSAPMATRPARRANPTAAGLVAEFLKQVEAVPARATGATKGCGINRHVSTGCNPKRHLVLRTTNGSSVESAEIIGLEALKPPTDFCRRALDTAGGELSQRRGQRLATDRVPVPPPA